jgi:hypothetical protein
MIDSEFSETAAFVDVNNDKKLDILSGEFWYEAPTWTKLVFATSTSTASTSTILPT